MKNYMITTNYYLFDFIIAKVVNACFANCAAI